MGRLNDIIREYTDKDPVRFHMPGHKGRFFNDLDCSRDITELFFSDNLYEPDPEANLIFELEKKIAKCFFKEESSKIASFISCSGATSFVQSAVLALYKSKKTAKYIICDRASHISFINILSLLKIKPLWVYPGENFAVKIKNFSENKNPEEIFGVFVTSPDYFGNMKDIKSISTECEKYSLGLIVDNSHGSHLAFYKNGDLHPVRLGADISVDSIHKTLPALTGAALLHAKKGFCGEKFLRDSMKVLISTSPSYMILQSIEKAVDFLSEKGDCEHERLKIEIDSFRKNAQKLGFEFENTGIFDPYRIVLNCENEGKKLYFFLADNNIFCEFYTKNSVILIPSILNCSDDFEKLLKKLRNFAKTEKIIPARTEIYIYPPGTVKDLGKMR